MKGAKLSEIKKELKHLSHNELLEICLRLSKFKKENKELLSYILYEASDNNDYIESVKREVNQQFTEINTSSYFFIKKSIRKILRNIKKYIRYTQNKEIEVELLIYFCTKLNNFTPSIRENTTLNNLYKRQIELINKSILSLHEDLQYDFGIKLEQLN